MARRATPPTPQPADLTPEQMRVGINKLRRRVDDLEKFDPETIKSRPNAVAEALEASIDATLVSIFGSDSVDYNRYQSAAQLNRAGYNMFEETPLYEIREGFQQGKEQAKALLEQAANSLEENLEDLGDPPAVDVNLAQQQVGPDNRDVFIVHGHDDAAENEVARFIQKADLNPIILHEQASGGMTVIEKLERYSDVGFAVVMLTPDDEGRPKGEKELQSRARQNVIAELFYFLGKLGRDRVCALKKGDIEIPSDIGGVVYIDMDAAGAWKVQLLRECKAAGYAIDLDKALL